METRHSQKAVKINGMVNRKRIVQTYDEICYWCQTYYSFKSCWHIPRNGFITLRNYCFKTPLYMMSPLCYLIFDITLIFYLIFDICHHPYLIFYHPFKVFISHFYLIFDIISVRHLMSLFLIFVTLPWYLISPLSNIWYQPHLIFDTTSFWYLLSLYLVFDITPRWYLISSLSDICYHPI